MRHTEAADIRVCTSQDYTGFKTILGNRKINEAKIKRIIKEIDAGNDMLKYYPIQVAEKNDALEIIDGQHRFLICKQLKRPIHYIVVQENKSLPEIAKLNSNVEKWSQQDFIDCYIKQGNDHYVQLNAFIKKHRLPVTTAISLLLTGDVSTRTEETRVGFEHGLFEVKARDRAIKVLSMVEKFKPFKNIKETDREFMDALILIRASGKIEIDDLAEKVQKHSELLTAQNGFKNYIFKLEEIYNIGKHSRVIIYEAPKKTRQRKEKPKPEISRPRSKTHVPIRAKPRFAELPKFKTIPIKNSDHITVKIDDGTTIMVKKGRDVEAAVKKFMENRGRNSVIKKKPAATIVKKFKPTSVSKPK